MVASLKSLKIRNYRSCDDNGVFIDVPSTSPLVITGENNAGKSNIVRALSLVLGDYWPGSYQPEDHEFHGRTPAEVEIEILVGVAGIPCPNGCLDSRVTHICWRYLSKSQSPCLFTYQTDNCACSGKYMNNQIRNQLTCVTVNTDRDPAYQMSYSSKWTTLSKLMRRFHSKLVEDPERVTKLKGFFEELVETFYEVTEFQSFASNLKEATRTFGGNLPYGLDIDFSAYDPSNFFRALRVFPHLNGESRAFEELGTGQGQILAVAFTYAYAKSFGGHGLVLAVEEPEAHLHPLAQEWLSEKLYEVAQSQVQVILTTHSPYFVDLSRPGSYVLVTKHNEESSTKALQLRPDELRTRLVSMGAPASKVTARNVGPFYENSATRDIKAGLFARACVLVEGPTEQLALPELLSCVGVELTRLGIAVVSVEGLPNLAKWIRFFKSHDIPVFPIFDTDSQMTGTQSAKNREHRREIFQALRIDTELDWSDFTSGPIGVSEKFAIMDTNYEVAMRLAFGERYEELEQEMKKDLGESKSLVARAVARTIASEAVDPSLTIEWHDISALGSAIAELISDHSDRSAASSAPQA